MFRISIGAFVATLGLTVIGLTTAVRSVDAALPQAGSAATLRAADGQIYDLWALRQIPEN